MSGVFEYSSRGDLDSHFRGKRIVRAHSLYATDDLLISSNAKTGPLSVRKISSTAFRTQPRGSVPPAGCFEQEPGAPLGFVDPYFDQTRCREVTMVVTHIVRLAQPRGKRLVVVRQLGEHVQWLDVFGIVI